MFAISLVAACSDKEESPNPVVKQQDPGNNNNPGPKPKTRAEQLKGHKWKMTAATTNPPINGSPDYYNAFMRACDRDNIYTFDIANGKLLIDDATDTCTNTKKIRELTLTPDNPTNLQSFVVGPGEANVGGYTHHIQNWVDDQRFQTHVQGSFGGFNFTIDYTFKAQ